MDSQISEMAPPDNQNVTYWLQNGHLVDSGVHSGAPSLCSTEIGLLASSCSTTEPEPQPPTTEASLASEAVPELIKLLQDNRQEIVSQAASVVLELAKKDASYISLQLIEALIQTLAKSYNLDTTKAIVATMYKLSLSEEGSLGIVQCNGILVLVNLLSSPVEKILFYAITTIHNLLLHKAEGVKKAVRLAGGLPQMVALLQKTNAKFLTIVIDCLQILAYGDEESKMIILAAQGPSELIRIMLTYDYENLLWTTSRVLKALSSCQAIKPVIVNAGGVQALAKHLGTSSSQRLVQNCLWTLRNLSDAATNLTGLHQLLTSLVHLLESSDKNIVTCVLGILCNLTCNNRFNKEIVCQTSGASALIRAIAKAGGREEIVERAVCALRHLTNRYEGVEVAQNQIRSANGIPLIASLLNPPSRWPLLQSVIGLIKNLALCPDNLHQLRDSCTVTYLVHLSIRAYQDAQTLQTYPDGVKIEAILEGALGALQVLANDFASREQIRENGLVAVLVRLLSDTESIQQVALKLLCKLAVDDSSGALIEAEGATEPLNQLLQSNNDGVTTYAAALLYRMSVDNPQDYRSELSLQLSNRRLLKGDHDLSAGSSFQDILSPERDFEDMDGDYRQQEDLVGIGFSPGPQDNMEADLSLESREIVLCLETEEIESGVGVQIRASTSFESRSYESATKIGLTRNDTNDRDGRFYCLEKQFDPN